MGTKIKVPVREKRKSSKVNLSRYRYSRSLLSFYHPPGFCPRLITNLLQLTLRDILIVAFHPILHGDAVLKHLAAASGHFSMSTCQLLLSAGFFSENSPGTFVCFFFVPEALCQLSSGTFFVRTFHSCSSVSF